MLIFIGGICNAICDILASEALFNASIYSDVAYNPKFWDFRVSWTNKYKNGDPKQGSKFFGSTTFLVFLTDAWHLYKAVWILCMVYAILAFYFFPPFLSFIPDGWVIITYIVLVPPVTLSVWGIGFEICKTITKK